MPSAVTQADAEATSPRIALLFSTVAVLSLAALYTIFHYHTHAPNQEELRRATEHLLQGQTHWITFQNRLLAPAIVQALQSITGWSWLRAFYVLIYGCMAGGGLLLVWHARNHQLGTGQGLAQAASWFLLAFVFNDGWSYPWDYVGALLNLLLVIWALDNLAEPARLCSWPPWAILLALSLNRESSLIAFAALLVAVLVGSFRSEHRFAWRLVLMVTMAAIANIGFVAWARHSLFVHSTRPVGSGPVNELSVGNFMQLPDNLQLLATRSHPAPVQLTVIGITALLGSLIAVTGWQTWKRWQGRGSFHPGQVFAQSYFVLGTAAIVVFAAMQELRVYFELIPFIVLLGTQVVRDRASSAAG